MDEANRHQFKFLLVEDDPNYVFLMNEILGDKALVQNVGSLAETMKVANGHDAVFLDLGLPDSRGIDTFTRVQEQFPKKPIVIVTGDSDEAVAFRAMRGGARDYIVKGHDSLERILKTVDDIIDELKREKQFSHAMRSFDNCLLKLSV